MSRRAGVTPKENAWSVAYFVTRASMIYNVNNGENCLKCWQAIEVLGLQAPRRDLVVGTHGTFGRFTSTSRRCFVETSTFAGPSP